MAKKFSNPPRGGSSGGGQNVGAIRPVSVPNKLGDFTACDAVGSAMTTPASSREGALTRWSRKQRGETARWGGGTRREFPK